MSYRQQNPYDGATYGGNPYTQQQSNPYDQNPPTYNSNSNPFTDSNRPSTSTNDMEMSRMPTQPSSQNPHYIMDECRRVTDETTTLKGLLTQLQTAQTRALNDATGTSGSPSSQALEHLNAQILTTHKSLIARLKYIKSRPESRAPQNASQIGLADRSLRDAFQRYRVLEAEHQKRIRAQIERQYRITRPDASEAEVRQAVEDPNTAVFSQALMNSNRRGESRQVLSAVRERHEAIARIEAQMVELATLFQDMERMVVEQEEPVKNIEVGAMETHQNVEGGVGHITKAVRSAEKARRKKWWCLLIVLLIIIIIVIVVAVAVTVLKN